MASTKAIPVQKAWKFCPRCGSKSEHAGSIPFSCVNKECSFRAFFTPVAAVGALILDSDGRMLFIERGKDPGKGKLGLPGGFVDAGETVETALLREIEEELNLEITEYQYLASFPNRYSYAGVVSPVADLFFAAWVKSFDAIEAQAGEVSGWRFILPRQVRKAQLAFETHHKAIRAFLSMT